MNKKGFIILLAVVLNIFLFCGEDSSSSSPEESYIDELLTGHWDLISPSQIRDYLIVRGDTLKVLSSVYCVNSKDGQIWEKDTVLYLYDYTVNGDTLYLIEEKTSNYTAPGANTQGVLLLAKQVTVVGEWEEHIDSGTFIPIPITIALTIKEADSTFLISVIQDPANYLYNHEGVWEIIDTVINLYGVYCEMMDTLSDSLVALPDSVCGQTMVLDTARTSEDVWMIRVGDLGPAIESLPISEELIKILKDIILNMERKE